MATIDGFWAGAQDHAAGVDLTALAAAEGGWAALRAGGLDALLRAGVPWPSAVDWARQGPRATMGTALCLADAGYPEALRRMRHPPPVLCVEGAVAALHTRAVAIVGTRSCTGHGRRVARQLGWSFAAAGWTVVSGLARGVDAEAHLGALAAGDGGAAGRTVAVVAHGLSHTAPTSHEGLRRRIVAAGGAVVSTWPDAVPPRPHTFPLRNAWIAGLAEATIVVEAGHRSGALSTARHALAEGREVFAVPGRVDDPASAGCLALLDDGAAVVTSVEAVVRRMTGREAPSTDALDRVVTGLAAGAGPAEVAARLGLTVPEVLARATAAELAGRLVRVREGRWAPAGAG